MNPRQTISAFLQELATPDPRFSPVPLWWWSGAKLEIGRLRAQLDQLAAMGIHNIVIINLAPSGTLFGCDPDDPPFLSEPWWAILAQVCDHARSIGTFIWFYDQIGFSGASYQAELAQQHPEYLAQQIRILTVEGTGDLTLECPQAGTPIAAYATELNQPEAVSYLPLDGRIAKHHANTPTRLSLIFSVWQGYDLFSNPACQKLLDTVHRQFERRLPQHLGTTIVGSFQDELPDLPTWGRHFADAFSALYGYSLEKVIHRLFEPGDAASRRTRLHYHAQRATLAEESFFKPFYHWHEKHHLQCGFDQQSPAREARATACVGKYADYLQTHRWYAISGSDHFGNGKLHASLAFMYDRPRVWLEGFHSTGWGGTIADTFDWLLPFFRSGVNLYNPHAVYYASARGWWEWAAPSTCWRQPYARHYKPFADMISRLCKLLSRGVQQASIGVIFPTATVQSAAGPGTFFPDAIAADETLHQLIGSMRWHQQMPGWLDNLRLDYHILDETTVQSATAEGGSLAHRNVRMNTLILPRITILHDETIEALRRFCESGGRLISIGTETIETVSGRVFRVSDFPYSRIVHSQDDLAAALANTATLVRCALPAQHRRDGDFHILFIPAVAGMATVVDWPEWSAPMRHTTIVPEHYAHSVNLELDGSVRDLVRFDPFHNTARRIRSKTERDVTQVKLDFEGSPFAILIWSDSASMPLEVAEAPNVELRSTITLSHAWTCEFVPTLPEEYGEFRWPCTTDLQWRRLDQPDSAPETIRATFGVRAWQIDEIDQKHKPLIWSPQAGILQDKVHVATLGPKGYVPEEFIDLGKCAAGQRVTIRTGVISDRHHETLLAIGANARKAVRANDVHAEQSGGEYLWMTPLRLDPGENAFDILLTAVRDGSIRLFYCLLNPAEAHSFRRPERLIAPGNVKPGSCLSFEGTFTVPQPLSRGRMKISVAAIASVFLDDVPLGRQGGFDPYRLQMRGQIYDTPPLAPGEHRVRIDAIESDRPSPLTADLQANFVSGGGYSLTSDAQWVVYADGCAPRPVEIESKQDADGAAWHLYRRAHPLPDAAPAPDARGGSPVISLPPVPPSAIATPQLVEWVIPPGAVSMQLQLAEGDARLQIDGVPKQIAGNGLVRLPEIALPPSRKAALWINSRQMSGGLLMAPVMYRFAQGMFHTGSALGQGLRSYSGAIRLSQKFFLDQNTDRAKIILDLGQFRGTVEVMLNGSSLGVGCLAPYRFDITGQARPGENKLELLVTNTLANLHSTCGPTRSWSPDQLEWGLFDSDSIQFFAAVGTSADVPQQTSVI